MVVVGTRGTRMSANAKRTRPSWSHERTNADLSLELSELLLVHDDYWRLRDPRQRSERQFGGDGVEIENGFRVGRAGTRGSSRKPTGEQQIHRMRTVSRVSSRKVEVSIKVPWQSCPSIYTSSDTSNRVRGNEGRGVQEAPCQQMASSVPHRDAGGSSDSAGALRRLHHTAEVRVRRGTHSGSVLLMGRERGVVVA